MEKEKWRERERHVQREDERKNEIKSKAVIDKPPTMHKNQNNLERKERIGTRCSSFTRQQEILYVALVYT